MTGNNRTMSTLSYGIKEPADLLKKLEFDAEKIVGIPHPYDIFNFITTAAIFAEWIETFYKTSNLQNGFSSPTKKNRKWTLPSESESWIVDISYIPNIYTGVEHHIKNCLSICCHTANATKHFHWKDSGSVTAIGEDPPIDDYDQYFHTSVDEDIYLDMDGENYGLQQIRGILLQFYKGLLHHFSKSDTEKLV